MMSNSTRRSATSIASGQRRFSISESGGESSAMLVKTCKTQLPQAQRVSHVVVQMSAENGNINHAHAPHGSGQLLHEGSNGGCLHRSISNSSSSQRPIPKENFHSSSSTSTSNKATMVSTKRSRKHSKRNTAVTTLPIESDDSNTSMYPNFTFVHKVNVNENFQLVSNSKKMVWQFAKVLQI